MKLYHWTKTANLDSIMKIGLIPNGLGIVYLTPDPKFWNKHGDILLKVETRDSRLTTFQEEDEIVHEVLCWNKIDPQDIEVL